MHIGDETYDFIAERQGKYRITLRPKQVFLSRMDSRAVFNAIRQKIHSGSVLTDDDLMALVILPLTVPDSEGKQKMLEKVVDLAEQIPDEGQRIFTLSGVIVASDKFINRDYMDQIRRRINMTQLGQLNGIVHIFLRIPILWLKCLYPQFKSDKLLLAILLKV